MQRLPVMSRATLDAIRLPAGFLLLAVVLFALLSRGGDATSDPAATPAPSIVVGEIGGEITSAPPAASPDPLPSASATAEPTPSTTPTLDPTAQPTPVRADDAFTAEVLACRSLSGSECNGKLGRLPAGASSFTALVRFTDAVAGDVMNAILTGPAGTVTGSGYALQGGGDGYYYSVFQASGLPAGEYVLAATRNGEEVATTTFRKVGR